MNNVVHLNVHRATKDSTEYANRVAQMDKIELLEEMAKFQEERVKTGILTPIAMVQARILFKTLEEQANTEELRILARAYHKHLTEELANLRARG